jgi:uncharacterized protein YndB with AHSA1/START domain
MTTTQVQPTSLEISKTINAPVEKVFKAWTEPEQIAKWFGCNRVANLCVKQDLRVGGEYRIEGDYVPGMQCGGADNKGAVAIYGQYKEIVINRKLVYTWTNSSTEHPAKDTLVSVEFIDRGNTTDLVLKHTNFALPASAEGHTQGWGECLEKFASLFAA